MAKSMKNHYEVLGVSSTATVAEIKAKYRTLVLKYHPDVNDKEDAQSTFMKLKEAFEVLSNEDSRAIFDEEWRIANAPTFRGEPWPTRKYKYQGAENGNRQSQSRSETLRSRDPNQKKHNIPEWERMHYGIGQMASPQHEFWPTGEKDEDLSDHQLYFKYRAKRKAQGGYFWTKNNTSKKYSTLSFLVRIRHFL